MGLDLDPRPKGWDEPPPSLATRAASRPLLRARVRQLSLRQIMIVVIYFAVVFWLGRGVYESDEVLQRGLLGVMVGLGLIYFGVWAAMRMTRFAFIAWIVFILGYMFVTASTISFFAIPSLPILIGAIIYLHMRRRSTNQDAMLWILAVAADRKMPLGPGVAAFSNQVAGVFQVWTESLGELLHRGASLTESLDVLPRVVPRESAILIRMGEESGDLAGGLHAAALLRQSRQPILQTFGARIAYLCWVLFAGENVVGFVLYFILPRFEAIFKDFGSELPRITRQILRLSHVVVQYGWLFSLAQLGVLVYLLLVFIGWGNLNIPVIDRLFRRRHAALILRALAIAVEADRPLVPALYTLAQWYPTRWVRNKLEGAAEYASQGMDWAIALYSVGLFTVSDVGVLDAARRAGNLPWALRELAETGERRFGYQLQIWSQIVFVLAMIGLGCLVFSIALAYFAPLITLIERLSE